MDDEVVERLRLKAELHGRPVEGELRGIIRRAAPLSREAKVALADRIWAVTPGPLRPTAPI